MNIGENGNIATDGPRGSYQEQAREHDGRGCLHERTGTGATGCVWLHHATRSLRSLSGGSVMAEISVMAPETASGMDGLEHRRLLAAQRRVCLLSLRRVGLSQPR